MTSHRVSPIRTRSRPTIRSRTSINTIVPTINTVDTEATSGSIVCAIWLYIATGSVVVPGVATKMVIVSSSKLWMKDSSQPPATPVRIIGNTTRRKAVKRLAPHDNAARSASRSRPIADDNTRRNAYGNTMITCVAQSAQNEPPSPSKLRNRRNAMPSTTAGIIMGERKNPVSAARPGKRYRAMASAAGNASATPTVAVTSARRTESQKASTIWSLARIALNQRSDAPSNGSEMKPLSVNETAITTTSGAAMNVRNSALNNRPRNPFCFMTSPGSVEDMLEAALGQATAAQHDGHIGDQQQDSDCRPQRPVQRTEELVVRSGRDHLETPPADQRRCRERRCGEREHNDRSGQHARQNLRQNHAPEHAERRGAHGPAGPFHLRVQLLQRRPYRHHHEGHQHVRQRDHNAGHGEDEADRFIGDVKRLQRIVQYTVIAEQDLPAERAHDHRYQQWTEHDEQADGLPRPLHPREHDGLGHAKQDAEEGHRERHACGAGEDRAVVGIGDDFKVVAQRVGRERALAVAEDVEGQHERQQQRHQQQAAEQQQRGSGQEPRGSTRAIVVKRGHGAPPSGAHASRHPTMPRRPPRLHRAAVGRCSPVPRSAVQDRYRSTEATGYL